MSFIVALEDCAARAAEVGGKAAGIGALLGLGMRAPRGFVVTTGAYRAWLAGAGLAPRIRRIVAGADSPAAQQRAAAEIAALFERASLPAALAAEVAAAYTALGGDTPVAVRSSAADEDGAAASFAGQQHSYLGVRGAAAVARQILGCWASLFSARAIAYRLRLGLTLEQAAMAVIVQELVAAEAAGVMMTLDPHTGDRSQIAIEGCYGLGVGIAEGLVTPDRYCVDKVALEIRARAIAPKPLAYRFDPLGGGVRPAATPPAQRSLACLSDGEALELARLGREVERALGRAQDIEWAIGSSGASAARELFLLQTRPETVWSGRPRPPIDYPEKRVMDQITALLASARPGTRA